MSQSHPLSFMANFLRMPPFVHQSSVLGMAIASTLVSLAPAALAQSIPEPILEVGVVQRFGAEPTQKIKLQPVAGEQLTLQFNTGEQPQTVTTTAAAEIEITAQPLPELQVNERVVLSTHRSFESAEDSANQWRDRGVEVEVAQPEQWQVWAKRDTYRSPLLRRLLLQNLQAHGSKTAFIDSQILRAIPKASFVVNGYRYQRDFFSIDSTSDRVFVTVDGKEAERRLYAGDLQLQPNAYGNYTLVNRVPIETYLRGVVPHEIGLGAPQPTMEAQAVLARTYALRNLRRFAIDNYQLCADTQCQVYRGLTGAAPETDRAITATRGQVLTYENELVDALYSSTTGGITAPFTDVWNGTDRPYLRAVVDSVQNVWDLSSASLADERNFRAFIGRSQGFNEDGWDMFRWRKDGTLVEIANGLKQYLQNRQLPLSNFNQILSIEVAERSPAGRVQRVYVETDLGRVVLEKDEVLRALLPPRSTLFYLEPIYETVLSVPTPTTPIASTPTASTPVASTSVALTPVALTPEAIATAPTPSPTPTPTQVLKGYRFVGGGLGHGVGMSQTGAYHLGELGWTHDRILSFYYPGTQLQPLNSSIVFWRSPD